MENKACCNTVSVPRQQIVLTANVSLVAHDRYFDSPSFQEWKVFSDASKQRLQKIE